MDRIYAYLKDPGWWFSAFFVALLTSIFAAYLKDWIGAALGGMSVRYRNYRRRKLRLSAHTINNIAADPGYMVFFTVRHSSFPVLAGLLFIVMLVIPHELDEKAPWLGIIFRMFVTGIQVLTVFRAREWGRELSRGMRKYKRRRRLYDINQPT